MITLTKLVDTIGSLWTDSQKETYFTEGTEGCRSITGTLEKVSRLRGVGRDLKIVVDGKTFYKRRWKGGDRKMIRAYTRNLKKMKKNGAKVTVYYKEENLRFSDWIAEKTFYYNLPFTGVPKTHNRIVLITYDND